MGGGGGSLGGEGGLRARVSDFLYKQSKSKIKKGVGGGRAGWGGGAGVRGFFLDESKFKIKKKI